ncbi:MAG TPA: DUF6266 family protein [Sphingobacteriaceae bacterium]
MGRMKNGANGPVSGKVGSVVGSSWRDVQYWRSLPKITKKRTESQIAVQKRMAFVNSWLSPFKPFATAGFLNYSGRMTWYNALYKFNHELVPEAEAPDPAVDYSLMVLSDGPLQGAGDPQVILAEKGVLEFTWKPLYRSKDRSSDQLSILLYVSEVHESDFLIGGPARGNGKCRFQYRSDFAGHRAEVFIGFISFDRKKASRSQYLGSFML